MRTPSQSQTQSRRRRFWRNFKFYIVGFAIVIVASLVSTGLGMLPGLFPNLHPLNQLATDLSGITLGGIIMVLGFMRDTRLEEERERTESAQAKAEAALAEVKAAQKAAKTAEDAAKAAQAEAKRQTETARAEAEAAVKAAQAEAKRQEERAERQREQAERQRERAERAEAELAQARYEAGQTEILARLRRLEERYGIAGPDAGSND